MSAFRASSPGIAIITVSKAARALLPLALLGACAGAAPLASPGAQRQSLLALQAADLRVATIAYRLAAAGEPICPIKTRLTGLTIHDAAQYAPALRPAARRLLGAVDRVGVLAVAAGSPAARAGVMAGDVIVSVDGRPLSPSPETATASYAGVAAAYAMLERASSARLVSLEIERAGIGLALPIAPVTGCASQVQLRTSPEIEAKADGRIVSVTTALLDYVANDDELALAIGHEMAHNALGHRAMLEGQGLRRGTSGSYGRGNAQVLAVERAADRLGYYLMARAGFDPGVAASFWERLHVGPARSRRPPETHPDANARIDEAKRIAIEIADKRAAGNALTP